MLPLKDAAVLIMLFSLLPFLIPGIAFWPKKPTEPVGPSWSSIDEQTQYHSAKDFALSFLVPGMFGCVISLFMFVCGIFTK